VVCEWDHHKWNWRRTKFSLYVTEEKGSFARNELDDSCSHGYLGKQLNTI